MLSHHKLKVYAKGLAVAASLSKHAGQWDKRHAVVDQLCRASESSILNLAEGYGRSAAGDRFRFFETAESSAVKAAAYLDLCTAKAELEVEQREPGVDLLNRIVLMMRALSGSSSE